MDTAIKQKQYNYIVSAELYRDGKYIGRSTHRVVAPHCAVAAQMIDNGVTHCVVDVIRDGEVL